ncbi:MAG: polyketide synthase, partial [Akkermansiaceae bacterium]|nr:polyketide synthase [Akkermansiaceae bacterium]
HEKLIKEPFPEPDADSLAGGLSNTISGRICNYFDFHGGGFTIDGACASSLLALENGCNSILNNSLDVVLVGGVDLSIDPFEIIGFARNGALAMNEMEVYSAKSEGFWPGEGCGVVVLMKESEAIARNLNIYAVIKGCGISSDGSGGITRPKSETQQLAFDRAYERAGYNISQVSMFEGHGTGTKIARPSCRHILLLNDPIMRHRSL